MKRILALAVLGEGGQDRFAVGDAQDLPAVPELDTKLLESLGATVAEESKTEAKAQSKGDDGAKPKAELKSKKK